MSPELRKKMHHEYQRRYSTKPEVRERRRLQTQRYRDAGKCGAQFTRVQKEAMLYEQGGLCQICAVPMVLQRHLKNSAHVDHDHQTGEVRGLICARCNMGLGLFADDALALEGAAMYLRKCA